MNKQIVLERIEIEHRQLEQTIAQLTHEQMSTHKVLGEWRVKDILAHLFDWEQRFIGWYMAGVLGHVPEIPKQGIGWDQLDILNQRIYETYREHSAEIILQTFHESYRRLLAVVNQIPEEDMFQVGKYEWLGKSTLVDFILANSANHYLWAKRHIQQWMKTNELK